MLTREDKDEIMMKICFSVIIIMGGIGFSYFAWSLISSYGEVGFFSAILSLSFIPIFMWIAKEVWY